MIFLVELQNIPGSLCRFLQTLAAVNLTRIESRPVRGHLGTSFFLLELEHTVDVEKVAMSAVQLRTLPVWPDTSNGYVVPKDLNFLEDANAS